MRITAKNSTHHEDLLVIHAPGQRKRVREIIDQAEEKLGDPTQNAVEALEAAGFGVVVDGAFRVLDDGNVVMDAEYVLGKLETTGQARCASRQTS